MAEKVQERVMRLTGIVAGVNHAEPEKDGANKGKIIKNSYVNLDITGGQLNFPLDYQVASKLERYQQVSFEFLMSPRLINGRHAPYCVFIPSQARLLG